MQSTPYFKKYKLSSIIEDWTVQKVKLQILALTEIQLQKVLAPFALFHFTIYQFQTFQSFLEVVMRKNEVVVVIKQFLFYTQLLSGKIDIVAMKCFISFVILTHFLEIISFRKKIPFFCQYSDRTAASTETNDTLQGRRKV